MYDPPITGFLLYSPIWCRANIRLRRHTEIPRLQPEGIFPFARGCPFCQVSNGYASESLRSLLSVLPIQASLGQKGMAIQIEQVDLKSEKFLETLKLYHKNIQRREEDFRTTVRQTVSQCTDQAGWMNKKVGLTRENTFTACG
jgi:hypothetical protein